MWISQGMVIVCIRSQSFRMGSGRTQIYLLSVFQIYLWRDPCKTKLGSSQRSSFQMFLKFYEKSAMGKHKPIASHSRNTSASAEDPIITVSTRRRHQCNVRFHYFKKTHNEISQAFLKPLISTFSAFRHCPSSSLESDSAG